MSIRRTDLLRTMALAITALVLPTTIMAAEPGDLVLSAFTSDNLVAFDEWTGDVLGAYTGSTDLDGVLGVTTGIDGLLYVACEESNMVLRFDPSTRAFVDRFVWDDPATPDVDETGGLMGALSVVFGPDDQLYVASFDNDAVYRYDGTTGAFDRVFVTSGDGGLNGPDAGMTFGPDGNLYVPSYWSNSIPYYDGRTGASLGYFVDSGENNPRRPRHLMFRGGHLYVSCEQTHKVMRFDAQTGDYVDDFVAAGDGELREPTGIGWGPDGNFYVASVARNNVLRYDGETGDFIDEFVAQGAGGTNAVTFLYFLPTTELRVSPFLPGIAGRMNDIYMSNATPGKNVALVYGFNTGSTNIPGCTGVVIDFNKAKLAKLKRANSNGVVDMTLSIPRSARGVRVLLQAVEPNSCRKSEVREFVFP